MSDVLDPGAKQREGRRADLQQKQLAEQQRKEKLKTLESEDEIARRKSTAAGGGLSRSLLATSQTGTAPLSKTLG